MFCYDACEYFMQKYINVKFSNLRDRVAGDFMSFTMGLVDSRVVGVLMGDEKSRFNVATVGVLAFSVEDFFVELNVVVVDSVVESDGDHLGDIPGWQITGNDCAVF